MTGGAIQSICNMCHFKNNLIEKAIHGFRLPLYFVLGLVVFSLLEGFELVKSHFESVLICIVVLFIIGVILESLKKQLRK